MLSPFEFRWSVDQDGYDINLVQMRTGPDLADAELEEWRICPRGGPLREYRPMDDHPDLWRRFAKCSDASGALEFVQKYGLLFSRQSAETSDRTDNLVSDSVRNIIATASSIRRIIDLIDGKHRVEASVLWNRFAPRLTAGLVPAASQGKFEFKPIPVFLSAALLLQAGVAIAEDQEWRHCRNDGCAESFRVGIGARTKRSEFCSDRCRVAWARHHKARAINA
jgi:hypothetical protein